MQSAPDDLEYIFEDSPHLPPTLRSLLREVAECHREVAHVRATQGEKAAAPVVAALVRLRTKLAAGEITKTEVEEVRACLREVAGAPKAVN
jgi:hypothetical protein